MCIRDRLILDKKVGTQVEIDAINDKIAAEIADAVDFAEKSEYPLSSELYDDNYVQKDYPFIMD